MKACRCRCHAMPGSLLTAEACNIDCTSKWHESVLCLADAAFGVAARKV